MLILQIAKIMGCLHQSDQVEPCGHNQLRGQLVVQKLTLAAEKLPWNWQSHVLPETHHTAFHAVSLPLANCNSIISKASTSLDKMYHINITFNLGYTK